MPYIPDWTEGNNPYDEPEPMEPDREHDPEIDAELEANDKKGEIMETDRLDSQIASIVKTLQIRYPNQKVSVEIKRQYNLENDKEIRVITYEIGDILKIRCMDDEPFRKWTKKLVTGTE